MAGNQLFDLLKQDHREAEKMMKECMTASQNKCESLFIDLSDALMQHMQLEEKHFYPKLENQQGMKTLLKDALQEHQETKQLLQELDRLGCDSDQWKETFRKMQQGVLHHVEDEEQKIFPKCLDIFSEKELDAIAQKCLQEKQQTGTKQGGRTQETTTRA